MTVCTRARWNRVGAGIALALTAAALLAAACGGTSGGDKTATAVAGSKPATIDGGATTLKIATDRTLGKLLTDGKGMTLYTYQFDAANSGKSAGEALVTVWPPVTADAPPAAPADATGVVGIITRVDGKKQVTYNGMPLYYFVNDKSPGDTKGQGLGGWVVAVP